MKPKTFLYDIVESNASGLANDVTGQGLTLTVTTPGDGLAHKITLTNNSVTDHSGKTVTFTGTDADGKEQAETLAAPGASATVTTAKYFSAVTSIVFSADVTPDTFDAGWSDVSVSKIYPLDTYAGIGATIAVTNDSTAVDYDIEQTFSELQASLLSSQAADWFKVESNKTAGVITSCDKGSTGVRLLVNSHTDGDLTMAIAQPRRDR